MSMLGIIQNLMGVITSNVNDQQNPFGLSKGQKSEIMQILGLIKNLISDGIQKGDINKLVTLMGEMAELMPEMSAELKEIIDGLKYVAKKMFEEPDGSLLNKQSPKNQLLEMESKLSSQSALGSVSKSDSLMGHLNDASSSDDSLAGDSLTDLKTGDIFDETKEKRFEIAENILNIVRDKMILSQVNFNALTKGLQAIENRASLSENVVDDNVVDGISNSSSIS